MAYKRSYKEHDYYSEFLDYIKTLKKDGKELTKEQMIKASEDFKELVKNKLQNKTIKQYEREQKEEQEANRKKQVAEEATIMELPMDWENVFDNDERTVGVRVTTPADALVLSQVNLGYVDIEYMSSITEMSYKEIIKALKGSIYQNPARWQECFYKGYETADEYLSGNLRQKLYVAREANRMYNGYFESNVKAIESILPKAVSSEDIYVTIGSPWVPVDIIGDFIEYMFRNIKLSVPYKDKIKVIHDEITGLWEIPNQLLYTTFTDSYVKYGTLRMGALTILEKTLNSQTPVVYDTVPSMRTKSKTRRVMNKKETALAIEKQAFQISVFKDWIWSNPLRKKRLEGIFDSKYASYIPRKYDGSFLTFQGLNPHITLYPYQKNAVARILFSKNTLLAHDVGSGKTYVMASAGMELKRIGLSKKNLYVVPNNIVGQWYEIFKTLYNNAKILCVDPKSFVPTKRQKVLRAIMDNDYDGIIMAYSCFNMIPLSTDYKIRELKEEKDVIENALKKAKDKPGVLRKKLKKLIEEIEKLEANEGTDKEEITFEKLGITQLFLDEAHNYKNVPLDTNVNCVYGVAESGSKKCKDMLEKVKFIQKTRNGGGVVMATGTPITNSLTDLFIMQKYLQSGVLSALDIGNFDSWIGMFAERKTEFEIDVDTSNFRLASRFSKFHNLPELTSLLSMFADFHMMSIDNGLPYFNGYDDVVVKKTHALERYLKIISKRADEVRHGRINSHEDNMLKITTDGRKAALDLRLVDKWAGLFVDSKVVQCAKKVSEIYFQTMENKSTQLVFCDIAVPGSPLSIYNELKRVLIKMGVNGDDIAFVHDAKSESAREKMFSDVRDGKIRILIGSTFKLGMGVNVQNKLIAIHHLDVPWRPADMRQREGRIIRQGNENEEVKIYRYITEGSFDAYSWQLLETKQNFITALLSGSVRQRTGDDVDDTVLSYGEIKALAVGNPLLKERVTTQNELSRNVMLKKREEEMKEFMQKRLIDLPLLIVDADNQYQRALCDQNIIHSVTRKYTVDERRDIREKIAVAMTENIMLEEEQIIDNYYGFQLIAPRYMLAEKPYIIIRGTGDYTLKLGDGERGSIVRIDNFFKSFDNVVHDCKLKVKELKAEQKTMGEQVKITHNYNDIIMELRNKLIKIDKELGADKK